MQYVFFSLLQLDEEGIGRVAVPDNALDELDTIMVGGILNSQFAEMSDTADYIKYSNFTGCMSGKSRGSWHINSFTTKKANKIFVC